MVAGVGLDALDGRRGEFRRAVVQREAQDAFAHRGHHEPARADRADGPAHRGADPMRRLDAQGIEQRVGQPGIEGQAVLGLRLGAPLREAAADGVGAHHAVAAGQVRGQLVHVAAGAGQAVPGHDHGRVGIAPFGDVDLAARADHIARLRRHVTPESSARSR
jgi:hypothetical protein